MHGKLFVKIKSDCCTVGLSQIGLDEAQILVVVASVFFFVVVVVVFFVCFYVSVCECVCVCGGGGGGYFLLQTNTCQFL